MLRCGALRCAVLRSGLVWLVLLQGWCGLPCRRDSCLGQSSHPCACTTCPAPAGLPLDHGSAHPAACFACARCSASWPRGCSPRCRRCASRRKQVGWQRCAPEPWLVSTAGCSAQSVGWLLVNVDHSEAQQFVQPQVHVRQLIATPALLPPCRGGHVGGALRGPAQQPGGQGGACCRWVWGEGWGFLLRLGWGWLALAGSAGSTIAPSLLRHQPTSPPA